MAGHRPWTSGTGAGSDNTGREDAMSKEHDPRSDQIRSPGDRGGQARTDGLRRVRRMSDWTAAALVVGTGAAAVALAHHALPVAPPSVPAGWASSATGTGAAAVRQAASGPQVSQPVATTSASGVTTTTPTGAGAATVTNGTSAPQVAHSVATTSASGVTTTTTTRVVNGKTVVTQVRNVPAYHDD
jgi:hypothetical protein